MATRAKEHIAAVVLAGGASRRLGMNKATAPVGGTSLLSLAVAAVEWASLIVVVAPHQTLCDAFPDGIPPYVVQTLEDPPFGGPVAGIVAGVKKVDEIDREKTIERVVLASCDVPGASSAVSRLLAEQDHAEGVCANNDEGIPQLLLGIYSASFLRMRVAAVGSGRGMSVRSFIGQASLQGVSVEQGAARDVDTPGDLRWARRWAATKCSQSSIDN
ncbi:NTP transferase domain-containing protein [Actinomycetaceae bacterium WB03_NA08]|uniref:NTP transferase domain-containing protein n=1 Tax=Scrofimicrobium canadense TaxID=2652290 RepID=A0A6N7VVV5_9ACTO|nr:NTP transferase domain-containing protein [Scrofimicrobium canadense]MSS85120.1 NTP transferase domain-containing protein [Scrofimicrobium canadense]